MITAILWALKICMVGFGIVLGKDLYQNRNVFEKETSFPIMLGIGWIADFFDTLGIGSFALTVAMAKATKQLKDRIIPGTLNVAHTIPTLCEAIIFTSIVGVESLTLIAMILSSVVGAWLGAGFVSRMEETKIQRIMGIALLITSILMTAGIMKWMPIGGNSLKLSGLLLIVGCVGNFALGALMTAGVGLYAPCMALVAILGMNPKAAFPIMMGSCAFLMPVASVKFISEGAYDRKATLAITIAGVVGVLVAAYVVKSLPLELMRWLVVAVVLVTSITMIRRSFRKPLDSHRDAMNS